MRILVIEDDAILSEAITHRLKSLGHGVDFTRSGQQAKPMLEHQEYDLILLDLNLPDTSGAQLLTAFRNAKHTTPVLVVTARHQVEERVRLLDLGADDYITKPFDFGELDARIRALLRRSQGQASDIIEFEDLALNRRTCIVRVLDSEIELKQREFRLLEIFMTHPSQVLSK